MWTTSCCCGNILTPGFVTQQFKQTALSTISDNFTHIHKSNKGNYPTLRPFRIQSPLYKNIGTFYLRSLIGFLRSFCASLSSGSRLKLFSVASPLVRVECLASISVCPLQAICENFTAKSSTCRPKRLYSSSWGRSGK